MSRRLLATLLVLALWTGVAASEPLEGVVLSIGNRQLTIRTSGGRKTAVLVRPETRLERETQPVPLSRFQKGDRVVISGGGSPYTAASITEQAHSRLFGRVVAVDPSRKEIRLDTETGTKLVRIAAGTAVFKENRLTSWLDLHQGQAVAVHLDELTAMVIFDPSSYVIREYQPNYGPLLVWGEVVAIRESTQPLEGVLEVRGLQGETLSVSYDRTTRWRLGARFKSPQDFHGVESLVFGTSRRARAVLSTRAIPYLFDTLSQP